MKKLIVAGVMALGILSASAQSKIGYIETDELISSMPEAAKVDTELKEYQATLGQQGQDLAKEADEKAAQFVKDSLKMTPTMKEIKKGEIIEMYQKVQNWNQIAQDKYNQKAQEKIAPVRQKALDAINAVAKEKGYTYVIDASTSVLLVKPASDDLMPFVKAKLGIKDTPQNALPKGTNPVKNN
jgi:outer membrane protein